jgi:hypothetical protein
MDRTTIPFPDLFTWKETRRRDKEGLGQPRPLTLSIDEIFQNLPQYMSLNIVLLHSASFIENSRVQAVHLKRELDCPPLSPCVWACWSACPTWVCSSTRGMSSISSSTRVSSQSLPLLPHSCKLVGTSLVRMPGTRLSPASCSSANLLPTRRRCHHRHRVGVGGPWKLDRLTRTITVSCCLYSAVSWTNNLYNRRWYTWSLVTYGCWARSNLYNRFYPYLESLHHKVSDRISSRDYMG